jgi:hypothetical protein
MACLTILLSACTAEEAKIEKVEPAPANTSANTATNSEEETVLEEQVAAAPEVFKIGDSVTFNDLVITLNSVEDNKGDKFLKPAEGNIYKIVDVTLENKGTEEKTVSSVLHTSMADSDGYTYTMTITTFIKTQLDGSVPAGRKLRGQVAYEVPTDAKGLEFIFSDPFTKGQAIWNLQ